METQEQPEVVVYLLHLEAGAQLRVVPPGRLLQLLQLAGTRPLQLLALVELPAGDPLPIGVPRFLRSFKILRRLKNSPASKP